MHPLSMTLLLVCLAGTAVAEQALLNETEARFFPGARIPDEEARKIDDSETLRVVYMGRQCWTPSSSSGTTLGTRLSFLGLGVISRENLSIQITHERSGFDFDNELPGALPREYTVYFGTVDDGDRDGHVRRWGYACLVFAGDELRLGTVSAHTSGQWWIQPSANTPGEYLVSEALPTRFPSGDLDLLASMAPKPSPQEIDSAIQILLPVAREEWIENSEVLKTSGFTPTEGSALGSLSTTSSIGSLPADLFERFRPFLCAYLETWPTERDETLRPELFRALRILLGCELPDRLPELRLEVHVTSAAHEGVFGELLPEFLLLNVEILNWSVACDWPVPGQIKLERIKHFDHPEIEQGDTIHDFEKFYEKVVTQSSPSLNDDLPPHLQVLLTERGDRSGLASQIMATHDTSSAGNTGSRLLPAAVLVRRYSLDGLTLAHEIGHLFGGRHQQACDPRMNPFTQCHGFSCDTRQVHSIMAIESGRGIVRRSPHWSGCDEFRSLGHEEGRCSPGPHENHAEFLRKGWALLYVGHAVRFANIVRGRL